MNIDAVHKKQLQAVEKCHVKCQLVCYNDNLIRGRTDLLEKETCEKYSRCSRSENLFSPKSRCVLSGKQSMLVQHAFSINSPLMRNGEGRLDLIGPLAFYSQSPHIQTLPGENILLQECSTYKVGTLIQAESRPI